MVLTVIMVLCRKATLDCRVPAVDVVIVLVQTFILSTTNARMADACVMCRVSCFLMTCFADKFSVALLLFLPMFLGPRGCDRFNLIIGDGVLPRRHPEEDATARPVPPLRPRHGHHRAREIFYVHSCDAEDSAAIFQSQYERHVMTVFGCANGGM